MVRVGDIAVGNGSVPASPGLRLSEEQVARLDAVSEVTPIYPYWHQRQFTERNAPPV